MVSGALGLAKPLDTTNAPDLAGIHRVFLRDRRESPFFLRNASCDLGSRPASAALGHDRRGIRHRGHTDLWLSVAFRTPQVFSGEGLHFFVAEIVERLRLRAVDAVPADDQDDQYRNVEDLRQKPKDVTGELLVA